MKLSYLFSDEFQCALAPNLGYLGHFVNERFEPGNPSVIKHSLPQISDRYRSGMPAFELPYLEVDSKRDVHFELFTRSIRPEYRPTVFSGESTVRMFIHPDVARHPLLSGRVFAGAMRVVPLASSRTVVVEKDPSVNIKLSTNGLYVGKYVRSIGLRELDQVNVIGGIFDALKKRGAFPSCFDFLPECMGCAIYDESTPVGDPNFRLRNSQDDVVLGCLYRDAFAGDDAVVRIPLFCLWSKDRRCADDAEFLVQLIERAGADPLEFLLREIAAKIIWIFLYFAFRFGVLLEMHGQNVLVEFDRRSGRIAKIVIQDMESVKTDYAYQRRLGLDAELFKPVSNNANDDEQAWSLSFDHRIGAQVFGKIALVFERSFGISRAKLQDRIREVFERVCRELNVDPLSKLPRYYSWHQRTGKVFADKATEYEKRTLPLWR